MDWFDELLGHEPSGIPLGEIAIACTAIVGGYVLAKFIEAILRRVAGKLPERGIRRAVFDALERPVGWWAHISGFWLAAHLLPFPERFPVSEIVNQGFQGGAILLVTWFLLRLNDNVMRIWAGIAERTEGTFDDQLVPIARTGVKILVGVVGGMMALQNMSVEVAPFLAGFGLGGAALALAAKDTVANVFGSIVIFVDRPFQIGDWIEVDGVEGTVEEVGLRVTRVRTFANSAITVPNMIFTTSPINNWSRMKKRRIKMTVGLTYDTTPKQMEQALEAIKNIISTDDRFHSDFYLVNFNNLGDSALEIFLDFFTKTTNWADYLAARESFLLQVMGEMQALGLEFAFPTQTILLEADDAAAKHPALKGAGRAMQRETPL